MSSIDLATMTIEKARDLLDRGALTSEELVKACLAEIDSKNDHLNIYLEVYGDVLEQARAADVRMKNGERLPLLGIPFALKDNILLEGKRAGAASKILEGYVAPYDSTAIQKMKEAGAIFVGRTNMDEFAMGSSTENSAYGPTKNPNDDSRVPGGSSGGAAAAVAINSALGALGSDTAGSVRQPASFCGVVGLKPTYGSVSRYGLMAMGSSLDVIGPFAKTVSDAEIIFNVIKGTDKYDSTSHYPLISEGRSARSSSKRIGLIKGVMEMGGIDEAVRTNYFSIVEKLKKEGFEIVEVDMPMIGLSLPAYYIIIPAEVSSNLARFDGMKYGARHEGKDLLEDYLNTRGVGFGKEARRRIILGTYVLSSGYHDEYYGKANKIRSRIAKDFSDAFQKVDAILTPTCPTPAFKLGEKTSDPVSMYLADIFTVPANLTKGPAISIPSGSVEIEGKELPLGIQLMTPHYREDMLLEIGKIIEKIR